MTTSTRDATGLSPVCVAKTGDNFSTRRSKVRDGSEKKAEPQDPAQQPHSQAFRGALFSADGTCIVTQHADQRLRTFVLPQDLLSEFDRPHNLDSYCSLPSASAISSYALFPKFDLQDPATTVVACAAKDLPIRLVNSLYPDVVHAQYPLTSPTTEEYIASSSLTWTRDGNRFLAGSANLISIFDASYDGSGPILQHKLAQGKGERKRYTLPDTCRGIVSAMSTSVDGILAVGTFQRNIALFTNDGAGECTTSLTLTPQPGEQDQHKGGGITHLAWSPCGTYLLVAERQSNCMQVYDVRNTFKRLSCLTGRNAHTMQRLGVDVVPTAEGFEVWAGGKDGYVKMWKNPGSVLGEHVPSFVSDLHRCTVWHPQGAVLATCTGRDFKDNEAMNAESDDCMLSTPVSVSDNVLNVWKI